MSCLSYSAIKAYWRAWACIQAASTSSMREFHRSVNGRTALFYRFWGWVCTYVRVNVCVCCSCSVTKSCPTLCNPMDCSMPDFPILHHLMELSQTHAYWVSEAIQPSHPLLSPSPPAFNLSQLQGLFQLVSSLHQVAKVLELQLQHQSFQWIFRIDFLLDWLIWSPCCPRDSQEPSPAP